MVLGHIHTNQLIHCCSDVSTIMFSNQSSVLFINILVGRYQVPQNPHGADCGHTKDCTHPSQHVRDNHNQTPFYKTTKSCNLVKDCNFIINFKKRPLQNMGKNVKSYATIPVHSPGKRREASQQRVQVFRIKYSMA